MKPRDWWRQRSVREKLGLGVALSLLVAAVLFLLLEPVADERRRLSAELPELRDNLAWMKAHAAEVRRLRLPATGVGEEAERGVSPARVEVFLQATGLQEQVHDMQTMAGQGLVISFKDIVFGDLLEFISRLQDEGYLSIARARINKVEGRNGLVTAELTLVPQKE